MTLNEVGITVSDMTDDRFDLADQIEQAMERFPVGYLWLPSGLARETGADRNEVDLVLRWMESNSYVVSNGRGGCWRRYGRRY
jgi:hypothetical protein